MSFRKESKYSFDNKSLFSFLKHLSSIGLKRLYQDRMVNSLYYDNTFLSMYHDSEEGVLPRKKIRFRWYDQNYDFKKEVKISSYEGRFKYSEKNLYQNNLNDLLNLKIIDKSYGPLKASILIEYKRSYFEINSTRVTVDTNIKYYNSYNLSSKKIVDPFSVIEIKTPMHYSDDFICQITQKMTDRFSKYCRGINFLKFHMI